MAELRERLGVVAVLPEAVPREVLRTSPVRPTLEEPGVRVTLEGVLTVPVAPRAGSPARRKPPSVAVPERTLPVVRRVAVLPGVAAAPPRAVEGVVALTPPLLMAPELLPRLVRKSRTEVATWLRC